MAKSCIYRCLLLLMCCLGGMSAQARGGFPDTIRTATQLDSAFHSGHDTLDLYLMPGDYHLKPKRMRMPVCDTCTEYIDFTYGLMANASRISIKGPSNFEAAIYTHAGYGIYFLNCTYGVIENLIVTGGIRDSDVYAPDAAIMVENSKVQIKNNMIFENLGEPGKVDLSGRGVMGIYGGYDSYLLIYENQIARNSGDGIHINDNAQAVITGNLIDGVDKADLGEYGGGQGVGIAVAWKGKASMEENIVKRYHAGIEVYEEANVFIANNLIEDIFARGMYIYDANHYRPVARIENNVIFKTGACGIGIQRSLEGPEPGYFRKNILVETGQNPAFDSPDKYCYQCALAVMTRPDAFAIEFNLFYNNRWLAPCNNNYDSNLKAFVDILWSDYSTFPLKWYSGYSEFIQRYYSSLQTTP